MLTNLLLPIAGTGDNAGNYYFESFGEACIYALIGFLIVIIGIVLIILIIWLIGLILRKTDNLAFLFVWNTKIKSFFSKLFKRKKDEEVKVSQPAEEEGIPDEVKAAIIVAIMAYYSEESPKCEFKVKRIKRI